MILNAFEAALDRMPPAWMRKAEAIALIRAFSEAFDVTPPSLDALSAEDALAAFREFTAACMEAALEDEAAALRYRERLGQRARSLGSAARRAVPVRSSQAFRLVRYLYRGIGIELTGSVPGELRFGPCSFAQRYTSRTCWFMSAFDEGFIAGVTGVDGSLEFTCRLTEGSPCCRAQFKRE